MQKKKGGGGGVGGGGGASPAPESVSGNVTIFYREKLASLFQVQEKLKACRSSKLNFSSSSFIADGSRVKIVWLHVVVFGEHDILHF